MGLILGLDTSGHKFVPLSWIAILIGLLIIPSHLIWKPYFVMNSAISLPVASDAAKSKKVVFLLASRLDL